MYVNLRQDVLAYRQGAIKAPDMNDEWGDVIDFRCLFSTYWRQDVSNITRYIGLT